MYYPNGIEKICYEQSHIDQILEEIKKNIPEYFQKFIDSEGSKYICTDSIQKLADKIGATAKPKQKVRDPKLVLEHCIVGAILDFNSDRHTYQEILNLEAMSEYRMDVPSFKNKVLRNQIPVIRKTLQNKAAKELDKYRIAFKDSQPGDLFDVTWNIIHLAIDLKTNWFKGDSFEKIDTCNDLIFHKFDEDPYIAWGVIGGGIKSHFIYKLYPEMFPNRGREAIWSLWYLSGKKSFGCKEDSEFLMINRETGSTQQNFFYPYGLFSCYALKIYKELKMLYFRNGIITDSNYRFVYVDAFLSFIARHHQSEIDILKQKSESGYYDF